MTGLIHDLAVDRHAPRALDLFVIGDRGGPEEPFFLTEDPNDGLRVGECLRTMAGGRNGVAYRISGSVYMIVAPLQDEESAVAAAVAARLREVVPRYAQGLLSARVEVPHEARAGRPALLLGFSRLRERAGWRPSSPARQARDVLLRLMAERRLAATVTPRRRVAAHAVAVGRELGLGLDELEDTVRAAELQDVGLLTLPDSILRKTSPLNELEWKSVRAHPVAGERILSAAPALASVARVVRCCYERYDGTGYPDGLRGEAIPLGARIVAVCVAFDAMTSPRPYREPRTAEDALCELQACAGRQFDPRVVAAFRRAVAPRADAPRAAA